MATRKVTFKSPPFNIRIKSPIELDSQTKQKIYNQYHEHVENYDVLREKVNSATFSKWKNQLRHSGGYKKEMVKVCTLLHKEYTNNIHLNTETKKHIAAVLHYAFDPIDIIPDWVPEIGYLDDVYCINLCLSRLKSKCPELWEKVKTLLRGNNI
jgi:uncharacterized membrane protein YkvA (DUF1232 family)